MYYKVIKNNRVIDLLENPVFVKYQSKNDIMLNCPENEAEGILSSDQHQIWHVDVFPHMKKSGIDTVSLIEIDKYEYLQLKPLGMKTPEEIIDAYTLSLIEGGVL